MENDPKGISRSKVNAVQSLVKKAVQTRRCDVGFRQAVPMEQWAANPVRHRLEIATKYLLERCCEAEWEELAQNPYPDDEELEGKLQAVERSLNGMMTFAGETAPAPESSASPERPEPNRDRETLTTTQAFHRQAATDYLYWLLEEWDWVREYRANLPDAMTEQEMVDFLLAPLSQVLSFEDFRQLGVCPAAARGSVVITKQWRKPKPHVTMAERELARRRDKPLEVLFTEFAVEVNRPEGTSSHLTIQREGTPEIFGYDSPLLDEDEETLAKAGGWMKEGYIGFDPGGLGDRDFYPDFPHFTFTAYPKSVAGETYALMDTLRENEFCNDLSANLRFLLMRVRVPLFSLQQYSRGTFVPQWRAEMRTQSQVTVPHWIMPEELADYWRQVRPQKARERRLPSTENTQLFRFVLLNTPPGSEPRWASLARGWNELSGEYVTRDKLYKTYHSVRDALFPDHPSKQRLENIPPWLAFPHQPSGE